MEQALINSGLSYAIIRPTVIFGREDILINNIAWLLRHSPFFPLFGFGKYELQPIYVEDMADLVVQAVQEKDLNQTARAFNWAFQASSQLVYFLARAPE